MRALVLVLALAACSAQDHQPEPAATPTPAEATPPPAAEPTTAPDRKPPAATAIECASDEDCAITTYRPEPVKDKSACCAALDCPRVTTRKNADDLAAAWSSACAAVRCRAPDCPDDALRPTATCRDNHCGG